MILIRIWWAFNNQIDSGLWVDDRSKSMSFQLALLLAWRFLRRVVFMLCCLENIRIFSFFRIKYLFIFNDYYFILKLFFRKCFLYWWRFSCYWRVSVCLNKKRELILDGIHLQCLVKNSSTSIYYFSTFHTICIRKKTLSCLIIKAAKKENTNWFLLKRPHDFLSQIFNDFFL